MKQAALNSFKESISSKLQKHLPQQSLRATTFEHKMEAAQEFYQQYQVELSILIEDMQVTYPVTNTIYLLHHLEKQVNDYFGIRHEYPEDQFA